MPGNVRKRVASRKFWEDTVDQLKDVLTDKDAYALEVMCMLYASVRKLSDFLLANGHTVEYVSDRGNKNMSKRPEVDILRQDRAELAKMMIQFGLTPRSGRQVRPAGKRKSTRVESMKDRY